MLLTPVGRKCSIKSSLLTSFLSITLTYLLYSIAPLAVAYLLISPLLSFASTNVPFPSIFRNFQFWDEFAFYFDSYCPSTKEYSSLSFSSAALFTSLALNASKSSILFGRVKRQSQAWWSAEEEAVSERRKAFAPVHRSDENCQAYIPTRLICHRQNNG